MKARTAGKYKSGIKKEKEIQSRYRKVRRRKIAQSAGMLLMVLSLAWIAYSQEGKIRNYAVTLLTGILLFSSVYFAFRYVSKRIRRRLYAGSTISKIDKMTGEQFENYLEAILSRSGYHVTRIGGSYDFGADLLIRKGRKRIVVQAKRYSSNVGNSAVQEVVGAKAFYKASGAAVITNSFFTKAAKELARVNNVMLLDRNDLRRQNLVI